jgi:hypothetical protein
MIARVSLFVLAAFAPLAAASAQPVTGESPAAEQTAQQPADAAAQQRGEQPAERRICRRVEMTGQRTAAQRVCMTAAEWRRSEY